MADQSGYLLIKKRDLAFLLTLTGLVAFLVYANSPPTFQAPYHSAAQQRSSASPLGPFHDLDRLVIVAGHSILKPGHHASLEDDSAWHLDFYQAGQGRTYIRHIERGVQLAQSDTRSLLVFSGGQTRPWAGAASEAQSYWTAAELLDWFSNGAGSVRNRTTIEVCFASLFRTFVCVMRACNQSPVFLTFMQWQICSFVLAPAESLLRTIRATHTRTCCSA